MRFEFEHGGTVLVTGGSGFIGSYVVRELIGRGCSVRVLDNMYRADPEVVAEQESLAGVDLREGDVRYRAAVEQATEGVDAVVHLAALAINKSVAAPEESMAVNLEGSQNVFAVAADAGVKRLVFASSASVYGEPVTLPMYEDGPLDPKTPYCIAKLAGEHLLRFHERTSGLDWTTLRFFNVYGPGQRTDAYYTTVVLLFVERLLAGEAPVIDGDGAQTMDFVHVRDVAHSIVRALEAETSRCVVNVGTGTQTSIAELARMLIELVGRDVEPEFRARDVLVTRRAAAIEQAERVLGWKPTVGVKEGLAEVVAGIVDSRGAR